MMQINEFYLMNEDLIYITKECAYTYTFSKNRKSDKITSIEPGYSYIHIGKIIRDDIGNFITVESGTGAMKAWFNSHYYTHLDKTYKYEVINFFSLLYKVDPKFVDTLFKDIMITYPYIIDRFPTLKQIRDYKLSEIL